MHTQNFRPLEGACCLIIDADPHVAATHARLLESAGTVLIGKAESVAEARIALRSRDWDLVLLELALADECSAPLAEEVARRNKRPALVVLSDRLDLLVGSPEIHAAGAIVAGKARFSECLIGLATAALAASGRRPEEPKQTAQNLSRRLSEFARAFHLTPREREILTLLASGQPPKVIGAQLGISYATVRYHATNLYRKCDGRTQRELLALLVTERLSD